MTTKRKVLLGLAIYFGLMIVLYLILGSDGIRSAVRSALGIVPDSRPAPQTCYRCNVSREEVEALGLAWANDPAIQF